MRIMSGFPSLVEIKLPANRDIRRLIVRSNLLSALKVGSAQRLDSLMEKGSSFASGSDASEHYPKLCGSLTERFGKSHPLLYRAINEVLLNVRHHAYDSSALQRLAQTIGNRFWHYSYATNDRVYFAVYDIGQGIPEGLRNLQNQFEPDEVLVEDAMKPGFSRTLMSGRGNGSVAMKRPVAEATANLAAFNQDDSGSVFGGLPVMHMVIVSGRAYYRLDAGHTPTATSDAKAELVGTFIEWTLPLAGEYE
ncbi:MAG TPA: hypothetical protein PLI78_12855 [Dokdonella sp.]|nr:hypothetical protein [Dokdonella sp.]